MLRIINNKKVDLTDSEFKLYQEICRSYDRINFKGEDLFKDLFESDSNGMIIFLKPPQNKAPFTIEVYLYLMSVMVHQHLGQGCTVLEDTVTEAKKVIAEGKELISQLQKCRDEISK